MILLESIYKIQTPSRTPQKYNKWLEYVCGNIFRNYGVKINYAYLMSTLYLMSCVPYVTVTLLIFKFLNILISLFLFFYKASTCLTYCLVKSISTFDTVDFIEYLAKKKLKLIFIELYECKRPYIVS